jgi:colanic acid/amylovoran biosynthesis protein
MVAKIALIGARLSTNLGGPSLAVTTKMALNTFFDDADYTLLVPRRNYEADNALAPRYDVKIAPYYVSKWSPFMALIRRYTGILIGSASVKATIKALEKADVIIDIWGIYFADTIGRDTFKGRMEDGFSFILGKILGKPVVKYTSDLGPFNSKWNRVFAKLYLTHFIDLILVRDDASRQCVEDLGVRKSILTVPDTAFLLPSVESYQSKYYETVLKESSLIGISVSYQARNRAHDPTSYLEIMAQFTDYLIKHHGAHVVLIPNELSDGVNDDMKTAEEICAKVADEGCKVLYTNNMLAQEIKGVIGHCEAVVAARYHTIVAALSLGIPTLAIGWHHKYSGMLQLFDQEHRLCEIENVSFEDLVEKFEDLWSNRAEIRKTIDSRLAGIENQISAGALKVHDLVSAKS